MAKVLMEVFPRGEVQQGLTRINKIGRTLGCCLLLRGTREGQTLRERLEGFLPKAQHMIKEKVDIIGVFQGLWITGIRSQGGHVTSLLLGA